MKYGICPLGLVPLRKENDHKSELVSQVLYGDCFKIIDERKEWFKIRLQWDGYEGWLTKHQAHLIDQEDYNRIEGKAFIGNNHLIDFVQLATKEIFPIPLGSDLRGLTLLNHSIDSVPINLNAKKRTLSKPLTNTSMHPICGEVKHPWALIVRDSHKWCIKCMEFL